MKKPTIKAVGYHPSAIPLDGELRRYLAEELLKLSAAINALAEGHIEMTYAEPDKPREGDIRLADGTNFNPTGSGVKGFYGYYAGAWHFLG